MGDRGNIVVKMPEGKFLCFYTHSNGSELPEILKAALIRGRECWDDDMYLARIIFCEMIKDDVMETSFYGLSTYIGDNSYDLLVVDVDKNTVARVGGDDPSAKPKDSWTFEQFLKLNINEEFGNGDDE